MKVKVWRCKIYISKCHQSSQHFQQQQSGQTISDRVKTAYEKAQTSTWDGRFEASQFLSNDLFRWTNILYGSKYACLNIYLFCAHFNICNLATCVMFSLPNLISNIRGRAPKAQGRGSNFFSAGGGLIFQNREGPGGVPSKIFSRIS